MCWCDYEECMAASITNQIQLEYYGVNRYISNEGITLEKYKQSLQTQIGCETGKLARHIVFQSFFFR